MGTNKKLIYSGGMHITSNSSGAVEYYHQDHLGSTRLKTNSTAGVVYESNYEPYGAGSGESGSEEYRYTGKREDPTGLYYFGARFYDPVTGRFTTRDKVFGDLADPQSLNRYSYCRNNPHKYTDPNGLWGTKIGFSLRTGLPFFSINLGSGIGGGFAITHDEDEGWQFGWYTEPSKCVYLGTGGGSANIMFEFTPEAEKLSDLEGQEMSVEADLGLGYDVSGGMNLNTDNGLPTLEKPSFSLGLGIGAGASIVISAQKVTMHTIYPSKRENWWMDPWMIHISPFTSFIEQGSLNNPRIR